MVLNYLLSFDSETVNKVLVGPQSSNEIEIKDQIEAVLLEDKRWLGW